MPKSLVHTRKRAGRSCCNEHIHRVFCSTGKIQCRCSVLGCNLSHWERSPGKVTVSGSLGTLDQDCHYQQCPCCSSAGWESLICAMGMMALGPTVPVGFDAFVNIKSRQKKKKEEWSAQSLCLLKENCLALFFQVILDCSR